MRVRHHVNPLSIHHLATGARPVALPKDRRIEIDLGTGEGDFLLARAGPDRFLVGVEIRKPMVEQLEKRIQSSGLAEHALAVYGNLLVDLPVLFSDEVADALYLQFPDPFFKKRQRKRRQVRAELVGEFFRILKPKGLLYVQTDIFDLALDAMAALEFHSGFENSWGAWTFARKSPLDTKTRRERYCEEEGRKIWRLVYQRSDLSLESRRK